MKFQDSEIWSRLQFTVYRCTYRVRTPMLLPEYKGSVFRGALGHHIRRISEAVYGQVFETSQASLHRAGSGEPKSSFLANLKDVPTPYVLEPPLTSKRFFEPGEGFEAHLILVGDAIEYLPIFVLALSDAGGGGIGSRIDGRRGVCILETIAGLNGWDDDAPVTVYSGADQTLGDESVLLTLGDVRREFASVERCRLQFLTPTRLKVKGRLVPDLSFEVLIRALMRRISALAYYYCGAELFFDPQSLLEAGRGIRTVSDRRLQWYDWERHSKPQGARLYMGGFRGEMAFEGNFGTFEPFLRLGEYLHVGKGTSLGLGKYRILPTTADV